MASLRGLEEAADAVGTLLQETKPAEDGATQIFWPIMTGSADGIVLHVVPNQFVGVQFGRIRR